MTNYENIATDNQEIINNTINYILKIFNISKLELNNNTRHYIRLLLKQVRDNNNQVKLLRIKRSRLRDDIADIEASMVGSQSFDGVQAGRNNGLIPNTTEIKYLHKLELKEELSKLAIETQLLEKSLEDNNTLIKNFINLLPSSCQRTIMIMSYIECLSNAEIASTLFYSIGGVNKERWRAAAGLENLLKNAT